MAKQSKKTKNVFLTIWTSKYGSDHVFDDSFDKAEKSANTLIKEHYPKSKDYKDTTHFGPSDSLSIYELPVSKNIKTKELTKLFNLIFVNSNLMKLKASSGND